MKNNVSNEVKLGYRNLLPLKMEKRYGRRKCSPHKFFGKNSSWSNFLRPKERTFCLQDLKAIKILTISILLYTSLGTSFVRRQPPIHPNYLKPLSFVYIDINNLCHYSILPQMQDTDRVIICNYHPFMLPLFNCHPPLSLSDLITTDIVTHYCNIDPR